MAWELQSQPPHPCSRESLSPSLWRDRAAPVGPIPIKQAQVAGASVLSTPTINLYQRLWQVQLLIVAQESHQCPHQNLMNAINWKIAKRFITGKVSSKFFQAKAGPWRPHLLRSYSRRRWWWQWLGWFWSSARTAFSGMQCCKRIAGWWSSWRGWSWPRDTRARRCKTLLSANPVSRWLCMLDQHACRVHALKGKNAMHTFLI